MQDSGDDSGSVVVLDALDRFALSAYDEKAQPELKIKGLSKSNKNSRRSHSLFEISYLRSPVVVQKPF